MCAGFVQADQPSTYRGGNETGLIATHNNPRILRIIGFLIFAKIDLLSRVKLNYHRSRNHKSKSNHKAINLMAINNSILST